MRRCIKYNSGIGISSSWLFRNAKIFSRMLSKKLKQKYAENKLYKKKIKASVFYKNKGINWLTKCRPMWNNANTLTAFRWIKLYCIIIWDKSTGLKKIMFIWLPNLEIAQVMLKQIAPLDLRLMHECSKLTDFWKIMFYEFYFSIFLSDF